MDNPNDPPIVGKITITWYGSLDKDADGWIQVHTSLNTEPPSFIDDVILPDLLRMAANTVEDHQEAHDE